MRCVRLALVLLVLSASACGDNGDEAAVSITSPDDGATVPSTFQVAMTADGFTVEPAGDVRDGAGHFHLIVDAECLSPGEQIPADETHIHLADGASGTELTLPDGEHTLCLQAGDGTHAAQGLTDTITVNVGGGGGTTTEAASDTGAEWRGTYDGEVVWDCGPAGTHRGTLEADLKLLEVEGGKSLLDVEHTVTGSCQDTGRRTTGFAVRGKRTDSEYTFPSSKWGVPGTLRLKIDGDRLGGRLTGPVPGPGRISITFDLACHRGC